MLTQLHALSNVSCAPLPPDPPQYWWVWIGLGAVLASTVINIGIFILAATFLKGAKKGFSLAAHVRCC